MSESANYYAPAVTCKFVLESISKFTDAASEFINSVKAEIIMSITSLLLRDGQHYEPVENGFHCENYIDNIIIEIGQLKDRFLVEKISFDDKGILLHDNLHGTVVDIKELSTDKLFKLYSYLAKKYEMDGYESISEKLMKVLKIQSILS